MCGRCVSPEDAEIERFWHLGPHDNNPFVLPPEPELKE